MQDKNNAFRITSFQAIFISICSLILLTAVNFRYLPFARSFMDDYEDLTENGMSFFFKENFIVNSILTNFVSILFWSLVISVIFIVNAFIWQLLSSLGDEVLFLEKYVLPKGITKKQYIFRLLKFYLIQTLIIFVMIVEMACFIKYTLPLSSDLFRNFLGQFPSIGSWLQLAASILLIFMQVYVLIVLFRVFRIRFQY